MNSPDAFDDLARQKLEGRSFPFDEGHWSDMQRVLANEQRRKRRGLYWSLSATLLLIGGGLAWMLNGNEAAAPIAQLPTSAPKTEVIVREENTPDTAPAAAARTEQVGNAGTTTPQASSTVSAAKHTATTAPAPSKENAASEQGTSLAPQRSPASQNTSYSRAVRKGTAVATTGTVVTATPATPAVIQAPPAATGAAPTQGKGEPTMADAQPSPTATTTDTSTTALPALSAATIAATTPVQEPTPSVAATTDTSTSALPALSAATIAATTPAQEPTPAVAATPTTAQDSATIAAAEPKAPPVIPDASPWELTAWGGLMRTHTTYSGAEVPWPGTISDANAPVFGAEVMHMGRNLGLGAGLHYINYAERYQQPEITTDVIAIDPIYSLISIDTSLLVVTGTVMQNGQVFYITENVDTTLFLLDIGADTTTTSIRTQEGLDRVNHVSYLELPLLIDGHVDAGNWRFGLRGGPTVGLLTGRRGSVPIADPAGSIALSDQPFREYMFGWTVRAYIRYKLSDRWWLGLEPMMRGQLMNAYTSGDLTRRSSGMGVGFSVSYRLP